VGSNFTRRGDSERDHLLGADHHLR
jgi:hypothetical protein